MVGDSVAVAVRVSFDASVCFEPAEVVGVWPAVTLAGVRPRSSAVRLRRSWLVKPAIWVRKVTAECGVTEDRVINTSPAGMLLDWSTSRR